jgi:hypothetical protein
MHWLRFRTLRVTPRCGEVEGVELVLRHTRVRRDLGRVSAAERNAGQRSDQRSHQQEQRQRLAIRTMTKRCYVMGLWDGQAERCRRLAWSGAATAAIWRQNADEKK